MQNFDIFCPSVPPMVRIRAKLKLVKFYRNFSRYNFEKLIRTLHCVICYGVFLTFAVCCKVELLQVISNERFEVWHLIFHEKKYVINFSKLLDVWLYIWWIVQSVMFWGLSDVWFCKRCWLWKLNVTVCYTIYRQNLYLGNFL